MMRRMLVKHRVVTQGAILDQKDIEDAKDGKENAGRT